jgi:hypothetical protein
MPDVDGGRLIIHRKLQDLPGDEQSVVLSDGAIVAKTASTKAMKALRTTD